MTKILIDRSTVEQVLEALWTSATPKSEDAITALRAALAEPTPPQEAKSWAEQVAYAAGWWAAMDAKRENT